MSLSTIPLPEVLESLSYETILTERKSRLLTLAEEHYQTTGEEKKFNALQKTLALESEPLVKLLQESAYRELLLRQRVNDAARAVMLPLAKGTDLDNLGALYGVQRGQLAGSAANEGNSEGQSEGNSEGNREGDEPYRQRLLLAPKSLSTAGSKAAYKFHALSAGNLPDKIVVQTASEVELQVSYRYNTQKNLVKDASVESPEPCVVNIHVLGFDAYGQLDSQSIHQVTQHLSGDRIRPLGDRINVIAAQTILYSWQLTLHFAPELEASPQIEVILQQVRDQLVIFVQQHHYLGKAIRHSTLLGTLSPLINAQIEGWVELTLLKNGEPLVEGDDLLLTSAEAPHLDVGDLTLDLPWKQRLEQVIEQSIEVKFDG